MDVQIKGDGGTYWNGLSWVADPAWIRASGTTSWNYMFNPGLLAPSSVTITARATDGMSQTASSAAVSSTVASGGLSGTVLSGGSPLGGVTVSLSPGSATATTTASGIYSISGLAPGTYTATYSKVGDESLTTPGLFIAGGAPTTQDVSLNDITRFEQSDSRVTYTGPWATSSSSSLSGGSYASGYATATALVKFDGTAIDLIGTKSRWGGIAEVSVDGGAYTLVDFYAPATANQQVIWSATGLARRPPHRGDLFHGQTQPLLGRR